MKLFKMASVGLLSVALLAACGDTSVETGGSNDVAEKKEEKTSQSEPKKDDGSKKFNAGLAQETLGLKINIAEVMVAKDRIEIGMNLESVAKDKLSFYPDQGNAIVGDMQLAANMFMGSGEVSGDINPGVKMDGVIVFSVPEGKTLDVSKVSEIKLDLGDIFNDTSYATEAVNLTIPVK